MRVVRVHFRKDVPVFIGVEFLPGVLDPVRYPDVCRRCEFLQFFVQFGARNWAVLRYGGVEWELEVNAVGAASKGASCVISSWC